MNNKIFYYKVSDSQEMGPYTGDELLDLANQGTINPETQVAWIDLPNWILYRDINAIYHLHDSKTNQMFSFYSQSDLDAELRDALMLDINQEDKIYSYKLGLKGRPVKDFYETNIEVNPSIKDLIEQRKNKHFTVLSGANNSGKTFTLKRLTFYLGEKALILLPNRFYELRTIPYRKFTNEQLTQNHNQFIQRVLSAQTNDEINRMQLDTAFGSLNKVTQDKLMALLEELLGDKFEIKEREPDMRGSEWFIEMNGSDFAFSSTGTRLLLTLLSNCMMSQYESILIDEPELGLSPKLQKIISKALSDFEIRKEYFPHLKSVWLTTHSHIFLDKTDFSNNFKVIKTKNQIDVTSIGSISEFNELQFDLLGNDIEELFLPSLIVIVEGESEIEYLKKVFSLKYPDKKITIVRANGDGGVPAKLTLMNDMLGGITKSPYNSKIIVVLDSVTSVKDSKIIDKGVLREHIIRWSKNGIEYYYPQNIIAKIFSTNAEDVYEKLKMESSMIEVNQIKMKKTELAKEVLNSLNSKSIYPEEMNNKLFKIIEDIIS